MTSTSKSRYAPWVLVVLAVGTLTTSLLHPPVVTAQDAPGETATPGVTVHVVQPGETLAVIAAHYGVEVAILVSSNTLGDYPDVEPGQRLLIPISTFSEAFASVDYPVGMNETLDEVATEYSVPIMTLVRLNMIVNPDRLFAGQVLRLPAGSGIHPGLMLTRVGSDQSLFGISVLAGMSPYALLAQNNLVNRLSVREGTALLVNETELLQPYFVPPWQSVVVTPTPLETGRSASVVVRTSVPGALSASLDGRTLVVHSVDTNLHMVLIGVPPDAQPAMRVLELVLHQTDGASTSYVRVIRQVDGGYPREQIRLSESVAEVLNDQQVIDSELQFLRQSLTGNSPERYWTGRFVLPTAAVLTSPFGSVRVYNDGLFSATHYGADFGAPAGTPIIAPAPGVVIDVTTLPVRGLITLIDHGWGVYTGYWHQSNVLVAPGDVVQAGQPIGAIGNTGLSTAAHLHWEMWVDGTPVDPLQWVRQSFLPE